MTYDPDPLYVPEPDSDEAHYEAAAAYFERLDVEPEDRRGFLALVFMPIFYAWPGYSGRMLVRMLAGGLRGEYIDPNQSATSLEEYP